MKKLPFLFSIFVLYSCLHGEDVEYPKLYPQEEEHIATDASGKEYPGLDPWKIYCGPGWGRKFCRFLGQYDGTKWTDGGSSITFSNFSGDQTFISFSNLDDIAPYGNKGWKLGETIYGDLKWNIEIKKDQVDVLKFSYDYYGSSEEIEYSTSYEFEVVNGGLILSNNGQTFTFNPS